MCLQEISRYLCSIREEPLSLVALTTLHGVGDTEERVGITADCGGIEDTVTRVELPSQLKHDLCVGNTYKDQAYSDIPEGKVVVSMTTPSDVPSSLALKGVTVNVYWVLGMRPEAVNVLMSVPVTVCVVLVSVKVGPKVTLYPVISLFLTMQATRSHWTVTVLGVGVVIRFSTLPLGAVRGRVMSSCSVCVCSPVDRVVATKVMVSLLPASFTADTLTE